MGVVYRATDSRFDRPVAIKFLSEDVADAAARRRFQREAQLASSLNHPHILTIFDVGEFADRQYLVTELVDGGTVRDWVAKERPGWRHIVETLVGVADGLAAAHKADILHRDIKPDNILVSKNGYAKIADFGIAKLTDSDDLRGGPMALTRLGTVMGTPGYMSPEQATGNRLDARSDVFSFAVVLYELLTGSPPFSGSSDMAVSRAVIEQPMPPLPLSLPSALRMMIEKALEKDPGDRYQSMHELVVDLRRLVRQQIRESTEQRPLTSPVSRRPYVGIAVVVVVALAAGFALQAFLIPAAPDTSGLGSNAFQRLTDFVGTEETPAVAPDGSRVAFSATTGASRQIWLRLLAGGPPLQLTFDQRDNAEPRWMPDSSALIYFVPAEEYDATGALWEVSALGGEPHPIADALGGGDVSHDGTRIAVFQRRADQTVLAILNRDGSPLQSIDTLPANIEYRSPRWSPDDRLIAYQVNAGGFTRIIYSLNVESGESTMVARSNNIDGHTWTPDGARLVYASSTGSTLSYPPVFNLRAIALETGIERQLTVGDVSYVQPDMVADGRLFASRVRMESDIWRFPFSPDPAESVALAERITDQTGQVQTPTVSADGTEIAYLSDSGGHSNVWVSKVDGSGTRQITFERDPAVLIGIPNWSPADTSIVYVRTDSGGSNEWLVQSDGREPRQLVRGVAANWTRDGQRIYFASAGLANCVDRISLDTNEVERVRCGAANPIISGDGQTLYFSPSIERQNQLMRATPEDAPAEPLAAYAAGRIPAYPTGYFLSPDGKWLAVPLKDGRTTNIWAISTENGDFRQVTDFGDRNTLITRQVSWSPDGAFIYAALIESDADVVMIDVLRN